MNSPMRILFNDFVEAVINIFIFLPYFFSVTTLLKTLFQPWKNITTTNKTRAFSLNAMMDAVSFNLISRGMGFAMRISVLVFYLIVQCIYVITIPLVFVLFMAILPLLAFIKSSNKSDDQRKEEAKTIFVAAHTLNPENTDVVARWFEDTYSQLHTNAQWWKLPNLFSTPPLARDWSVGFTPTLDTYCDELTDIEYQKSTRSHIIGRDKETHEIERTLSQSDETNVILVGETGVGKHTIIHSFARRIYEGRTTTLLAYKRILTLNMEKILTEFTEQKKRELFIEDLLKEAAHAKNVIIIIDRFERYVSSGDGHVDMSLPLLKYAKTSDIQIIGITTPFLYEKYIYPTDVRSVFTKIDVSEITKDEALKILMNRNHEFETRYNLTIPYDTLLCTVEKSGFFMTSIPFPEKALQLIDASCVFAAEQKNPVVTPEIIDTVLSQKTHTPTTLTDKLRTILLHLEEKLKEIILGQDEAISEISRSIRRSFLLLGKRKKPMASFLFLGPTGVGKTETAKVISHVFFGAEKEPLRFDMSLYQSKEDIAKLIGSIEKLNPGLLTNIIRENPYGVLLIDEIEKANHDLLNIFLTILDEGYFTDGYGQRVDCKNLIIVATSNAGSDHIYQLLLKQSMGNQNQQEIKTNELIDYLVTNHLFAPEFLNRFDGVIAYKPIGTDMAQTIAKNIVKTIEADIQSLYKITVHIPDEMVSQFISQGYSSQYGVRNLERTIRQGLEDIISKKILSGEVKEGGTLNL